VLTPLLQRNPIYGVSTPALTSRYIKQKDYGVVLSRANGARIGDKGWRIEADRGNRAKARALIDLAKVMG
jgi:hypothetical protein